jgi:hypothetical protein
MKIPLFHKFSFAFSNDRDVIEHASAFQERWAAWGDWWADQMVWVRWEMMQMMDCMIVGWHDKFSTKKDRNWGNYSTSAYFDKLDRYQYFLPMLASIACTYYKIFWNVSFDIWWIFAPRYMVYHCTYFGHNKGFSNITLSVTRSISFLWFIVSLKNQRTEAKMKVALIMVLTCVGMAEDAEWMMLSTVWLVSSGSVGLVETYNWHKKWQSVQNIQV